MPPAGVRGRRGSRRGSWKRENSGRLNPASQSVETESQQQQSSNNKVLSGRDSDLRQDDKQGKSNSNRKGAKRVGRPPGRGRSRRGRGKDRTCSETQTSDDEDGSHRKGGDTATHESSAGEASGHEMDEGETETSARHGRRKIHKRAARRSAPGNGSEMDVESEGENVVSDTDVDEGKAALHEGSGGHRASDFPFAVFKDGRGVLRAKQATFVLPICVGSIAFWQGKKAPEKKCYRWVVYVRSPGGVDLSHVIRRVKFQLHPSFPVPERNIDKPPYELEESGWGEFEILVSIEFHDDAAGPPVDMTHSLKLYTTTEQSTKKPVINEKYDEIVFSEPPAVFLQRVRNAEDRRAPPSRCEAFFPRYSCHLVDDCMHRIDLVRSKIRNEVRVLMAKAEASGVQVDLPPVMKMMERPSTKEAPTVTAPTTHSTRFDPETPTKTRIIIDADNEDMPLSIETEHVRRRGSFRRHEDAQEMETPQRLPSSSLIKQEMETSHPALDKGEAVDGRGQDVMEIDHRGGEGQGRTSSRISGSCSKGAAELQEPELYEDVSSSGECADHNEAQTLEEIAAPAHSAHPLAGISKVTLNDNSSLTDNSPKESGSSYGAASGT